MQAWRRRPPQAPRGKRPPGHVQMPWGASAPQRSRASRPAVSVLSAHCLYQVSQDLPAASTLCGEHNCWRHFSFWQRQRRVSVFRSHMGTGLPAAAFLACGCGPVMGLLSACTRIPSPPLAHGRRHTAACHKCCFPRLHVFGDFLSESSRSHKHEYSGF